jgi:hypothetical protein
MIPDETEAPTNDRPTPAIFADHRREPNTKNPRLAPSDYSNSKTGK